MPASSLHGNVQRNVLNRGVELVSEGEKCGVCVCVAGVCVGECVRVGGCGAGGGLRGSESSSKDDDLILTLNGCP